MKEEARYTNEGPSLVVCCICSARKGIRSGFAGRVKSFLKKTLILSFMSLYSARQADGSTSDLFDVASNSFESIRTLLNVFKVHRASQERLYQKGL